MISTTNQNSSLQLDPLAKMFAEDGNALNIQFVPAYEGIDCNIVNSMMPMRVSTVSMPDVIRFDNHEVLVHCKVFIGYFWRAKAPGLPDRKSVYIDLILTDLRSGNRGDFRTARNCQ